MKRPVAEFIQNPVQVPHALTSAPGSPSLSQSALSANAVHPRAILPCSHDSDSRNEYPTTLGYKSPSDMRSSLPAACPAPSALHTSPTLERWQKEIWHFLSGSIAGSVAKTLVYPMDRLKMIYQVKGDSVGKFRMRTIFSQLAHVARSEGPLALWKGNLTSFVR
jgi:hypothetical protein